MTYATVAAWLLANWKPLGIGIAFGVLLCTFFNRVSKTDESTQVAAVQKQEGTIQASGKVKIAAVPARAAIPCPDSKICPPCAEQPAVEVDFGASATGSQGQAITATVKSGDKGISVALGGGSSFGPVPVAGVGALVTYGPGHVAANRAFDGTWSAFGYYDMFSW